MVAWDLRTDEFTHGTFALYVCHFPSNVGFKTRSYKIAHADKKSTVVNHS